MNYLPTEAVHYFSVGAYGGGTYLLVCRIPSQRESAMDSVPAVGQGVFRPRSGDAADLQRRIRLYEPHHFPKVAGPVHVWLQAELERWVDSEAMLHSSYPVVPLEADWDVLRDADSVVRVLPKKIRLQEFLTVAESDCWADLQVIRQAATVVRQTCGRIQID